jgi:hypothetical protein
VKAYGECQEESETCTITGATVGVEALKRLRAVRWGVAGNVAWAWPRTIPATALVPAGVWALLGSWGDPTRFQPGRLGLLPQVSQLFHTTRSE